MPTPERPPLAQSLERARAALDDVDPMSPSSALPLLREAAEHVTEAIDEALTAVILAEGATIRSAGALAGLSENAVGPRLARTRDLGAYSADTGRVTAKGVERALYDLERGSHQPAEPGRETTAPMRFRARRPTKD